MITLKTLPNATAQEVFDQVATHLLNQKKKSKGESVCLYRHPDGLKCAAGCLISDEEYNSKMENVGDWNSLIAENIVPDTHSQLIYALQRTHDSHIDWNVDERVIDHEIKLELLKVANNFNLKRNF